MSAIRVAMVRCDGHAAFYAPVFGQLDPLVFREPVPRDRFAQMPMGWQRGGMHMFYFTRLGRPTEMCVPFVDGFEITKLWDPERENAEILQRILSGKPRICETLEQASDDVDLVFISDCIFFCSDHVQLAGPGLRKGVPTFVDKPFASTLADVRELLRLATTHEAPILSLSLLRELPGVKQFAKRLGEIGELQFVAVQGGSNQMAGIVHPVSLAQHLVGSGVESVRCMGSEYDETRHRQLGIGVETVPRAPGIKAPLDMHLYYGQRADRPPFGTMINAEIGQVPYGGLYASCFGSRGRVHSPCFNDYEFPTAAVEVVKRVKEMVQTRKSPAPHYEMAENIAVIEAARLSDQTGKLVRIRDVMESNGLGELFSESFS